MVGENSLSENQFGFRKSRPTLDAIQAVVDIARKARKGSGKCKGFCALISIYMQFVQYREMEDLHRGDGAEEGSRLPIADER